MVAEGCRLIAAAAVAASVAGCHLYIPCARIRHLVHIILRQLGKMGFS